MNSQEIAYIIFSFLSIAVFISIFFFTYVANIEGDIIKTQISDIIKEFISSTNFFLTPEQKSQVSKIIIENLSMPDMSKADTDAQSINDKLIKQTVIVFGILIGTGTLIISLMWYFYRIDIFEIVKYSLIILILVIATEFLFVTVVIKNYRLVDQNYINYLIVNNLEKYADS